MRAELRRFADWATNIRLVSFARNARPRRLAAPMFALRSELNPLFERCAVALVEMCAIASIRDSRFEVSFIFVCA